MKETINVPKGYSFDEYYKRKEEQMTYFTNKAYKAEQTGIKMSSNNDLFENMGVGEEGNAIFLYVKFKDEKSDLDELGNNLKKKWNNVFDLFTILSVPKPFNGKFRMK